MKLTEPTIKNDYHKKAFISTICLMTTQVPRYLSPKACSISSRKRDWKYVAKDLPSQRYGMVTASTISTCLF